jgi:hypothetical protein
VMRASIRPTRFCKGAFSTAASWVSGATIAPTSWACSTSSGGSFARVSTSASLIVLPDRTPPRSARIFVSLAASLSAFARRRLPRPTNAIAGFEHGQQCPRPLVARPRRVNCFTTEPAPCLSTPSVAPRAARS